MNAMFERDWRIKDNLILCANYFNREHLMNWEEPSEIFTIEQLFLIARDYAKRKKIKMVEATKELKEFVRNNKNMSKFCLQREISSL